MTPLDYAKCACDTMMRRFSAPDLPPRGHFHYHQGVFLSGMRGTWELTQEKKYFDYIKAWVDSVFDENGGIRECSFADLDDIQPGILLFPLLSETKDPYYEKCLRSVYEEVKAIPRNPLGGYWHKTKTPDQMWLDGLYMAGPFCAEYASRFGLPALTDETVRQALLMKQVTGDEKTGLMRHAWDGRLEAPWADPETGRAPEFWGRSLGWVPVALLDELTFIPKEHPGYAAVRDMAVDLLKALCRYQSADGRWYQVVDKGEQEGNWLENSCSCLYAAALCRAVRNGFMEEKYLDAARRGYEGVIKSLSWAGEDLLIGNVCVGTGVGDYAFYCARPTSVNDLHGVGAFLLMCVEMQKCLNSRKEG